MRVGVDGRALTGGGARGIAHYTSALVAALTECFPEDEYAVVAPRRLPTRIVYAAVPLIGRPRIDRMAGGCDVVLVPAPAPVAPGDVPYVLTVHDRSWEARPDDFTPYERLWHRLARPRALARGAARVIADSRAVAADLERAWALPRVDVVALAPRPLPPPGAPPDRPYFLFVGALEPRKGVDVLARAWASAGVDADLRVVGEGRLGVLGAIREGRVDDARLATLYAGARALVIPSLLEGYGLPAAEARAAGTPVIASDLPVLRELLGAGARWVPPGDADALAAALCEPPPPPAAPLARTWHDVARETRAVLAEAAGC